MVIVCTREQENNAPLMAELARAGLEAISLPLIKTSPRFVTRTERLAIESALVDERCVVCFTSPNGVRYCLQQLAPLKEEPLCTVAVQGSATARAYTATTGFVPPVLASGSTGADLGRTIIDRGKHLTRALLLGPLVPRPELAETLLAGGLSVERIVVYETSPSSVSSEHKAAFASLGTCLVLFHSPSSVSSFIDADLASANPHAFYVAFGPTTAEAMRKAGLAVVHEHRKGEQRAFVAEIVALVERLIE